MQPRDGALEAAIVAGGIVVLALLGPFGTFAMPLAQRALLWAIFVIGGYAFFRPVIAAASALARQSPIPLPVALLIACALAALPTTLIVGWVFAGLDWQRIEFGALTGLYPLVVVIGVVLTGALLLARRGGAGDVVTAIAPADAAPPLPPAETPPPPAPSSASVRLPESGVLCIENEDHYIRVHTIAGSQMLLMRLRDAVAEMAGTDGARVHRGWWVARDAGAEVVRDGRSVSLRLTNGLTVPVARSMVAELRSRGWLGRAG